MSPEELRSAGLSVLCVPSLSETHLRAELQRASGQDLRRRSPRRAEAVVDREERTGVERVVDVELGLDALVAEPERAGEAEVELLDAILVERLRREQVDRDRGVGARREIAAERWCGIAVAEHEARVVRNPRQILIGHRCGELVRQR